MGGEIEWELPRCCTVKGGKSPVRASLYKKGFMDSPERGPGLTNGKVLIKKEKAEKGGRKNSKSFLFFFLSGLWVLTPPK